MLVEMQEKKMSQDKKNPEPREAPDLIAKIKKKFNLTQPELASVLPITQQAVSEYELGKVKKERYDVIKVLQKVLSGEIVVKKTNNNPAQTLSRVALQKELTHAAVDKTSGATQPERKRTRKT